MKLIRPANAVNPVLRPVVALAMLLAIAGCQQAVQPPTPEVVTASAPSAIEPDVRLQQKVLKALKPMPADASISVEVRHSIVALVGEVPNISERLRLVEAAKSVPGVKAVVRFIDVMPPQRSDHDIENDIRAALLAHPSTKFTHPVISVTDGVVALAGYGSEWQVRYVARRLAEKVPGVKEVLTPLCLPYETAPDDRLQKTVSQQLADAGFPPAEVAVNVSKGRVSLHGTVPSTTAKLEAMTHAFGDAVRSVEADRLKVTGPSYAAPPADTIKRYLQTAFAHDPRIDASRIAVRITGSTVSLSGTTSELKSQQLASRLAASVPGVKQVDNKIVVHTATTVSDATLLQNLRDALLSDPGVDLYQLDVAVAKGRARLTGNTSTPREKWRATDIALHIQGITGVDNTIAVTNTTEPRVITTTFFSASSFSKAWWTLTSSLSQSDTDLLKSVSSRLAWDPSVDNANLKVTAEGGAVTLAGLLTGASQTEAAIDAAFEAGASQVTCLAPTAASQ